MSMANPKVSDLNNRVTFQNNVRMKNADGSTTEAWSDHIENCYIAIVDGDVREPEVLGRPEDQRTVDCWGRTDLLRLVRSDMRLIWSDPGTQKTWIGDLNSHPVEIAKDHSFMKFAPTLRSEETERQ